MSCRLLLPVYSWWWFFWVAIDGDCPSLALFNQSSYRRWYFARCCVIVLRKKKREAETKNPSSHSLLVFFLAWVCAWVLKPVPDATFVVRPVRRHLSNVNDGPLFYFSCLQFGRFHWTFPLAISYSTGQKVASSSRDEAASPPHGRHSTVLTFPHLSLSLARFVTFQHLISILSSI